MRRKDDLLISAMIEMELYLTKEKYDSRPMRIIIDKIKENLKG